MLLRFSKPVLRYVSMLCILSLLHLDYKVCAGEKEKQSAVRETPVRQAEVQRSYQQPATPKNNHQVYLITDAHCVPEVQFSISDTLRNLHVANGVDTVFIEGCSGQQDFDYLRLYPLPNERDAILVDYVKKGIISGVEYFSCAVPIENVFTVYGIENESLITRNRDALTMLTEFKDSDRSISIVRDSIRAWFDDHACNELNAILHDSREQKYDQIVNNILLDHEIADKPLNRDGFASMFEYFSAVRSLKQFDSDRLLTAINTLTRDEALLATAGESRQFIQAQLINFYIAPNAFTDTGRKVRSLIEGNDTYAPIADYLNLREIIDTIDYTLLGKQIDAFIQKHMYALCRTEDQQRVLELYLMLDNIDRLLSLEFTNSDTEQLFGTHIIDTLYQVTEQLPAELRGQGTQMVKSITPAVFAAINFYELALQRDRALKDIFLSYYQTLNAPCAVVVGGFHAARIRSSLEQLGIPHTTITPAPDSIEPVARNVYIQHFSDDMLNPALQPVYNKQFLGTKPILSLSNGLVGPPAQWFNEILGELVERIRPFSLLVNKWLTGITQTVVRSTNKVKTVILLVSLATMLGYTAPAVAQDASQPAAVSTNSTITRAYNPQLSQYVHQRIESQLILSDKPQDIKRRIAAYSSDMFMIREQVLADLHSGKPTLQEKAVTYLFERNDIPQVISVFEESTDLALKELIVQQCLTGKRYDLLARMFAILELQKTQDPSLHQHDPQHIEQLGHAFDALVIREANTNIAFLENIERIKDTAAKQKIKFMLTYYIQSTSGDTQNVFARSLMSILEESELDIMYYAYRQDIPQTGQPQRVFDMLRPNIFYVHSSELLRDLARQRILEISFVLNLDNLIRKGQKRLTVSLYQDEAAHAQTLYDFYQTGNPDFLSAARSYFPTIYTGIEHELETRKMENRSSMAIQNQQTYTRSTAGSTPMTSTAQPDADIESWTEPLSSWYQIEQYIKWGSNISRRENLLRTYYSANIEKLTEFFIHFNTSQKPTDEYMRNMIIGMLDDLFIQDADTHYNISKYNPNTIRSLIYLSRYQTQQGLPPSAFNHLITSLGSDYLLADSIAKQQLEGIQLSAVEISALERELKSRFVRLQIEQKLNDIKLYPSIGIVTNQVSDIARMRDDLARTETATSHELDVIMEKYASRSEYTKWRTTLDQIVEKTYQRPSILNKVLKISFWPLTVLFLGGTLLMGLIRKYRVKSPKNGIAELHKKFFSPPAKPFREEVTIIENFANKRLGAVTVDDLKILDGAVLKLKKDLKFLIAYNDLNNLFKFLAKLYHSNQFAESEKKLIKAVFINLQVFSQKDKSVFQFFPQSFLQPIKSEDDKQQSLKKFFKNITQILFFNLHLKSTIKTMDQLVELNEFKKRYNQIRFRIMVLRTTLLSTQALFFIALSFAPFFVSQTVLLVMIMAVMFIIKGFDISLFYIFNQYNEQLKELFELNFSRVAKFDNRVKFAETADAIAKIEAGRWAMISVMMTLFSSIVIVAIFSPWFMVPYIALVFLILLLAHSRIMQKNDLYSPMYDVIIKTMGPVFGLVLNALMEAFVMTNLLEALIKAGQAAWIINPMQSFDLLDKTNALMSHLTSDEQVISASSWNSQIKTDRILSQPIEAFEFNNISSYLHNKADRPVVNDVSMNIKRGDLVFIHAISGMGKSTFGRLLAHYTRPAQGETGLVINGRRRPISPHRSTHQALRKVFNYLKFQHFPNLSITKMLTDTNQSPEDFINFVDDFLPNIREYLDQPIKSMREDERRFILLALYIFNNKPSFLVLDDLLLGINEKTINICMHFLDFVRQKYGTSVVLLDETMPASYVTMFDQSYVLSAGKLISMKQQGTYEKWVKTDISSYVPKPEEIEINDVPEAEGSLAQMDDAEGQPKQASAQPQPNQPVQPQQSIRKPQQKHPGLPEGLELLDDIPQEQWDGVSSVKEFFTFIHTTQTNEATGKKRLELPGAIHFVNAVTVYLKRFSSIQNMQERLMTYQRYRSGNAAEKVACALISSIASEHPDWYQNPDTYFGSTESIVRDLLAFFAVSDNPQYRGIRSLLARIPEDHIIRFVRQDGAGSVNKQLVSLLCDTVMHLQAFAREDIAHQMTLWQDYTNEQASDAEKLTAEVITMLLSTEASSFEDMFALFTDTRTIAEYALRYIDDSDRFKNKFMPDAAGARDTIIPAVEFEILKRHYVLVDTLFASSMEADSLTMLNASPISSYELWGLKKLFDRFELDYAHFLEIATSTSYTAFRSNIFSLLETGFPVTIENLRSSGDVPAVTTTSRQLLLEKLKLLNQTPEQPVKPTMPKMDVIRSFENAA